jgi:ribosomal protein S18 acetylase RimI-like enzyme
MPKTSAIHFTVERATFNDAEGIFDCLSAAFEPYRALYTPAAYEDTVLTRETVRQRMQTMTVLVARDDAAVIIGTVAGAGHGAEGHIRGMAVAPAWQGTRLADVLLHGIEEEMRLAGCSFATLDTTAPLARAIRFYERNGCARSGVVSDFFGMALYGYRKQLPPEAAG